MYGISFELACFIDVESCPFLGILTLMSVQGQYIDAYPDDRAPLAALPRLCDPDLWHRIRQDLSTLAKVCLARAKARPCSCQGAALLVSRHDLAHVKGSAKWSRQLPNCFVPLLPPGSITASTAWSIATCSGHFRTCLGHASGHDQCSYPTAGNRLDLVHPHLKGLDPRFSKGHELLGGAWSCPGTGVLAGVRLSPTGSGWPDHRYALPVPRRGLAHAKARPCSCKGMTLLVLKDPQRFDLARAKARPNLCPRNVPRFSLARAKCSGELAGRPPLRGAHGRAAAAERGGALTAATVVSGSTGEGRRASVAPAGADGHRRLRREEVARPCGGDDEQRCSPLGRRRGGAERRHDDNAAAVNVVE
ncbi:hypothetical protein Scep_029900 [Stephania cephalantha]|uniref:Uncharacterized protein n=1 Tax=Stephania cephalantha TaxID=152367 RepID=A0AAP0HDW5_9MAGN